MYPRLPALAAVFAAGILASSPLDPPLAGAVAFAAAAVLVALVGWRRLAPGALAAALAFLCGGAAAALERSGERAFRAPGVGDRTDDVVTGIVRAPVEDRPQRRRFVLEPDGPRPAMWVSVRDGQALDALPGDRVRVRGRLRTPRGYRVPGATDLDRVVRAKGARLQLSADVDEVDLIERGARLSARRWPARVQRRLSRRIAERGGDTSARAAVRAMVTGDRGGIDRPLGDRFRDAGIAHVLAVSGLHLAVVALLAFAALRRLWAAVPALALRLEPARAAALVAAPLAIAFTLITGARVSTLRALLVVLVVLVGAACDRRARVIDALGLAALALLAWRPSTLYEPSFQLSFAATATLALALTGSRDPGPVGPGRRLVRGVGNLLRASLWAAAATAPITALHFGRVATGGIVANLVAVPATEIVIVPFGLAGALLGELWPAVGGALVDVAIAAAALVIAWADRVGAAAPVWSAPFPGPLELVGALMLWTAAVIAARRIGGRRLRAGLIVLAALVLAIAHLATTADRRWSGPGVRVTFLDVGQGDAAVVELPDGAVWLVDAGGLPFVPYGDDLEPAEHRRRGALPGRYSVARYLRHRRVDRIDVAIVSHPHPDHYMGLAALAGEFDIGALWVARPHAERPSDVAYHATVVDLALRGTAIVRPPLDRPVRAGGVELTVLAPRYFDAVAAVDPVRDVNDNSLVLRLSVGGRSILFAGDVESEGEQLLVERHGDALAADVVKVAHHGSPTSSTPTFVAATRPRWAVVSCGPANRFGFPAPEVVDRWRAAGARVLRTDRRGAVTVTIAPDGAVDVRAHD